MLKTFDPLKNIPTEIKKELNIPVKPVYLVLKVSFLRKTEVPTYLGNLFTIFKKGKYSPYSLIFK